MTHLSHKLPCLPTLTMKCSKTLYHKIDPIINKNILIVANKTINKKRKKMDKEKSMTNSKISLRKYNLDRIAWKFLSIQSVETKNNGRKHKKKVHYFF